VDFESLDGQGTTFRLRLAIQLIGEVRIPTTAKIGAAVPALDSPARS